MEDVHKIGGIPALLKYLLKHTNLIDGNQMTVTGKTIAENLEDVPELDFETQDVIKRVENPIKSTGHLTILRGSLAPGTAVAKLTGKEGLRFEVRLYVLYDPKVRFELEMTGCCQMLRQVTYTPGPRNKS
jgi:dihydroxy-acid dehydratase